MLAPILHKILKMDEPERHPYYPRPSSAGPQRCERQMVYHRIKQPEDHGFSGRMLAVFEDSTWDESQSADIIAKSAFQIHSAQMKVICYEEPGWQISGAIDGIITDPLLVDRLWEHKAVSHWSFERYWNGGELPDDYFTQVAFYMRGVQAVNPDITEAVLLIKNKNTLGYLDYLLRYDRAGDSLLVVRMTKHTGEFVELGKAYQGIVTAAMDKFKRVERHAKDGTLPDRLPPGHWRCDYCPYNGNPSTCWGKFVEETTLMDTVDLSATLDGPGLVSAARQYLLTNADLKTLESTKDTLRDQILTTIRGHNAKKGTVEGYAFSRSVQTRDGKIRWEEVPGSVKRELDAYRNADTIVEVLRVTEKKKGDKGA